MREIKFRAWEKKGKRWLHGYSTMGGCDILGETIILGSWMSEIKIADLNDVEVMQYTGLKDKNGKEIYDGDIIAYQDDGDSDNDFPFTRDVVEFRLGAFHFNGHKFMSLDFLNKDGEIIGNIYENPELLTGGQS